MGVKLSMIGLLEGHIFYKTNDAAVVKIGGVGYFVRLPHSLLSRLGKNEPILLYVHTHVREDALDLFGFPTSQELSLFELLLSVSGIGPKTALAVVDHGVAAIQRAVSEADVVFFTSIPRLGTKNAQKIIIELKSKLGGMKDLDLQSETDGETQEVIAALTQFGFSKSEVIKTLRRLPSNVTTVEEKIKQALKIIGDHP